MAKKKGSFKTKAKKVITVEELDQAFLSEYIKLCKQHGRELVPNPLWETTTEKDGRAYHRLSLQLLVRPLDVNRS